MNISTLYFYPAKNVWTMPISQPYSRTDVDFVEIEKDLAAKLLRTGEFDGPVKKGFDDENANPMDDFYIQFNATIRE